MYYKFTIYTIYTIIFTFHGLSFLDEPSGEPVPTQQQQAAVDVRKSSNISSPHLARVKRNESNSSYDISPFNSRKPSNASSKFSDTPQVPSGK